ncbi:hypothetical protein BV20DRAFT_985890 [Pilatotrama ljubarskyi]|nr:hypothetical protein BV20DRAFT_985890 [Pilatotrama ljubarskyi]
MPWRAGRDFRHLYHAAQSLLERSRIPLLPTCLIVKPLHSTRVLWQPAVALKLSHSHASATESVSDDLQVLRADDDRVESVLLRWKRSKVDRGGCALEVQAPPNILALLDEVFNAHPTQPPTLRDLRRSSDGVELATYLRLPQRAPALVFHLLDCRDHQRALWVLQIANEGGYNFSPKFYGQVAERLAALKKWSLIRRLTLMAKQHLGYTTSGLLNWRLQALTECQNYVSTQDALNLFEKEQVRPSRLTYHLLIAMHLRNHDLAAALASVRIMESAGLQVSARTWAVILLNHRSFGLAPSAKAQALAALEDADGQTATAILNSLVQLLLDAHDMPGVIDILSLVSQPAGGHPVDHGGDTTLEGDASAGHARDTRSQYPNQPTRHVVVDISTYNVLLDYLARRGDLTRAMETLEQMRAANILPDGHTATALIRLYFAADHPNDALHIAADALRTFPAAVALLPRLGFSDTSPPTHPVYPRTATPTIDLFNVLISGVLETRGLSGLNTVLRMMRTAKVDADNTTLSILMSYLHRCECPRPREMIRAVRALMSAGISPNLRHLHVLMAALLREERFIAHPRGWANQPLPEEAPLDTPADEPRLETDDYSHPTAGIAFPRHLRYRSLIRPIIQSLQARGVRSDRVAFAIRIKHDGVVKRDLEMAIASFRKMVDSGMVPNEYHYGALMEGYVAAGDMNGASDVMREAEDAGVRINVKTHTIIIAGYARQAQPTQAVQAFRKMVAEGIRPDVPAIDALVSAFFRAKAYKMARRVLLQLWPQVGPISDELLEAPLRQLAVAFRALHGVNRHAPERLSSGEQRMLRWKIRDILQQWKDALGYKREKVKEAHSRVRPVRLPRNSEYTRAKGC